MRFYYELWSDHDESEQNNPIIRTLHLSDSDGNVYFHIQALVKQYGSKLKSIYTKIYLYND